MDAAAACIMGFEDLTVENAEKRLWHLILLSVAVILYLTLVVVSHFWSGVIGGTSEALPPEESFKYSVFLSILVLLFCGYMIMHQRSLVLFSQALIQEKKNAEMLHKNVEVLEALLEVSSSINSQQQLQDILNTVTKEMLTSFRADHSSIMLVEEQTETIQTKASYGQGAEFAKDALIPLGKSISGWVVANAQPLLLNGQVDDSRFPGTTKKKRSISSALCVPLKMQDRCIGVLNVNLIEQDRTFSENDLKLLTIFANNAAVAIHNSMLQREKTRRISLQTMLGQLHSPQIVQKIVEKIESGTEEAKRRERVELTILFSDIRGFSSMLNVLDPEDIMGFLDEFYTVMNRAVFDNEGSIDKFIGDEVMAFFGAPLPLENSTRNGLKAAKEMLSYFQELKEKFSARSHFFENLGLGIGLNTGEVMVGNVGSETRYEYTVIGTAVNLAKRLCAHALPNQILTTEKTLEKVDREIESECVEALFFKGIPDSVVVHRVKTP